MKKDLIKPSDLRPDVEEHISRFLIRTTFGYIHVIQNTDFDPNLLPVICLHMSGHSGRSFRPILRLMSSGRRYIAIDYPGYGDSDPPPLGEALGIEGYAKAAWQVLDALGVANVHIFGHHTGSKVAAEMCYQNPAHVHKVIIAATSLSHEVRSDDVQAPVFAGINKDTLADFEDRLEQMDSCSFSPDVKAGMVLEFVKSGPHFSSAQRAALKYNQKYAQVLSSLPHEIAVVNLNDELKLETPMVMSVIGNGVLFERMQWGHGFLESAAADVATFIEGIFHAEAGGLVASMQTSNANAGSSSVNYHGERK